MFAKRQLGDVLMMTTRYEGKKKLIFYMFTRTTPGTAFCLGAYEKALRKIRDLAEEEGVDMLNTVYVQTEEDSKCKGTNIRDAIVETFEKTSIKVLLCVVEKPRRRSLLGK